MTTPLPLSAWKIGFTPYAVYRKIGSTPFCYAVAAMDLTQKLLSSTLPADSNCDDAEAPPKDIALIAGLADDDLPVLTTEHALPDDPPAADTAPSNAALEPLPATNEDAASPADEPVEPPSADETLSPAVRRLVRQYELDVTAIQGSGPSGRIRVSDVMAHLGGRTYTPQDIAAEAAAEARTTSRRSASAEDEAPEPVPAAATSTPITTLFECDMANVLAHRKQLRQQGMEVVLTSYYLVAAGEALRAVPEAASASGPVRLGTVISLPDGNVQTAIVDAADGAALDSLHDRLLAVDKQLRFSARSSAPNARLVDMLVHHHGVGGSLLATPTPIGEDHTASVGIGRVRREITVRGEDATPRVAALCYVSLSFVPERLELPRANRFVAQLVRVLEQWPS